ncbi:hypothetical protein FOA52_000967 [Chlamydomonas sp. UWO 241]|nr:hypothetical protein FOA52_000967 [Chlamydomonas sp. UWO 241]
MGAVRRSAGSMRDARAASAATSDAPAASASTPSHPMQKAHAATSTPTNPGAPTFQDAISRLQAYWASCGCAIYLPHNTEVGAGTMNPATFLRVQGPEPWKVCYAEPSIRPDDSRYGDNPNRLQRHTQFQVILKPDPGNSQELYLGSLEALGIDTKSHDIRFVEDNWESPVLGAWGLGWEVWLDGMEVTQFTYFQQAGSKVLEAPAVEITYGLERILMSLQGVKNFRDIRYNKTMSYGELFLQNEYEMSCYNLDEADIEEQRTRFDLYAKEARRLLDKRLPVPAYDHCLKLSHTFNILDARGAVGVTERANCFAAMRKLCKEVTSLWMERREELGYPLGLIESVALPVGRSPDAKALPKGPADFVLEVGTEELPPDEVDSCLEQLRSRVPALLTKLRLSHAGVSVEGTPRRLAVVVSQLSARQTSEEARVRGPPAKAAFKDGVATKALEGFCKKNGVDPATVTVEPDEKGVEYVYAVVADAGQAAGDILCAELPALLASFNLKKSMRWAPGKAAPAFSRPVRWLLALHGTAELPFSALGLVAGRLSRGLRNSPAPELTVEFAEHYLPLLKQNSILLDTHARKDTIWQGVQAASAALGGAVPDSFRGDLLSEVSNLVESPTVITGAFDPSFLQLPSEVLVMVMRKHQRYFPVFGKDGALMPAFVTVANGPVSTPVVAAGNEAVLRARFEDAAFFYREDLKQKLADFRPKLNGTLFQKDLGSLLDKSNRVEGMVTTLAVAAGLQEAAATATKAAHLAKADLATATVTEMTALAGVMGRHYATVQGEDPAVALAVFESVLPRQAGDALPQSPAGILVSVADRLDSLVGLFAAGCAPTASTDQYGLRRAAVGLLQALVSSKVRLSLRAAVALAAAAQPVVVTEKVQADVLSYLTGRMEQVLLDAGVVPEAVRATLAERGDDPALAMRTAEELNAEWSAGEGGRLCSVMAALGRPVRIVRGKDVPPATVSVSPALFDCDEERALADALASVRGRVAPGMAVPDFLDACEALCAPIDAFFDKVFVMCDDEAVRANRLALLRDVAALPAGVVDLSQLPGF